jgi:hypothetical protein
VGIAGGALKSFENRSSIDTGGDDDTDAVDDEEEDDCDTSAEPLELVIPTLVGRVEVTTVATDDDGDGLVLEGRSSLYSGWSSGNK